MKIKWIFLSAMFFSLRSCNIREDDLKIIEATGLDSNNLRLNSMFFCNSDTGFVVGSLDQVTHNPDENSDTFAFVNRTALLYKTTDGGKTWIGKDFGEGSFTDIVYFKNYLFVFKTSENYLEFSTYSSNDFGNTWNKEGAFPQGISKFFFIDSCYIAITSDSLRSKSYINVSKSFGGYWTMIESPLPIYDAIVKEQKLFFLSSNIRNDYKKNLLVEYNINDSNIKVIDLPKEFDCYSLTNYNNEVKLTGVKDEHLAVYSLVSGNHLKYEYSYLKDASYFPQGYYNNKGVEWVIAGKRGVADVSNKILRTDDNGKNWKVINFEKEKYIEPFYFLNVSDKIKAWFYAGSGRFQVLQ